MSRSSLSCRSFLPLVAALWLGGTATAQLAWQQRFPSRGPGARARAMVAFDERRGVLVLFGGSLGSVLYNDTWEWDGTTWTQRLPATVPPARKAHAMAYDAASRHVVMFGGERVGPGLNDTWEWDGTNWLPIATVGTPSPRWCAAMAYDAANGVLILFGGYDGGFFDETWELNGTRWKKVVSASSPTPRADHAMAYDARRQRILLFGGGNSLAMSDETWEWDGTNWLKQNPIVKPSKRSDFPLAFDEVRARCVLFGGTALPSLSDTWEWDGVSWVQRFPASSPPGRSTHVMGYDQVRGELVLFGGLQLTASGVVYLSDTWVAQTTTRATYTPFGSGCPGSGITITAGYYDRPWINDAFTAMVRNVPLGSPVSMLLGSSDVRWGPFALPLDLTGTGMTGCQLLASPDLFLPLGNIGGAAPWSVLIPNNASLVGAHFYNQAFAIDPGANPAGVIASDGADAVIGAR